MCICLGTTQAHNDRLPALRSSVTGAAELSHNRRQRPKAAIQSPACRSDQQRRRFDAMERLQAEAEAQMRRKAPAPLRDDEPAAKRRKARDAVGSNDTAQAGASQRER